MEVNTTHDWSVPSAELDAWLDCWCAENMTQAITDIGCCSHRSFVRWCSVECSPDCGSTLATECIQECPAMCFEAQEYIVDRNLCTNCNTTKCFPVMRCLTRNAEQLVESGQLDRTCHESDFLARRDVLDKYKHCWQTMPKHSSHWNVLSAFVHCSCREGMIELTRSTDCCESLTYGGGICDVTCPSEQLCASQDAQTCIHSCNELCPALDPSPDEDCKAKCLLTSAPCRPYLGCRTPMLTMSNYVCEDGRWPEASTGCCAPAQAQQNWNGVEASCPSLCETKKVWRLDGPGLPWWGRYSNSTVYQCTCDGCPAQDEASLEEVKKSLEESIWDNGQVLLVDIARREGLKFGPNRRMQELMVERNQLVLEESALLSPENRAQVETKIQDINTYYSRLIAEAAREYPDTGLPAEDDQRGREQGGLSLILAILLTLAVLMVIVLIVIVLFLMKRRKAALNSPVTNFTQNEQIVIGSPVPSSQRGPKDEGVVGGAAVTVAAPTKGRSQVNGES